MSTPQVKLPTFCGVVDLAPEERMGIKRKSFFADPMAKFDQLKTQLPVFDCGGTKKVSTFHKTAYSTVTGDPIAYYDIKHWCPVTRTKVSDRFIFTVRDGLLKEVEHISRRAAH